MLHRTPLNDVDLSLRILTGILLRGRGDFIVFSIIGILGDIALLGHRSGGSGRHDLGFFKGKIHGI
jgi:hypothetical protein